MSTVRFAPGKRQPAPDVGGGQITIPECLTAPKPIPRTKAQIILPAVVLVAFIGMIVLIFSQPSLRQGPMAFFSLLFPVTMLMSFGGMMMMGRFGMGAGDKTLTPAQMEVARREYLAELDEIRDEVHEDAAKQFKQFQWLHPEPGLLRGVVGSPRMWNRPLGDTHFGWVRLGVGKTTLVKKFDTPLLGRPSDYEPITYHALNGLLLEQKMVHGIAKPVSMTKYPGLALVGESGMEPVYALARAMICQAALFHSPRDLKVMVVTDDVSRWEWLKWLPHCQHSRLVDTGGQARMVWGSPEEMDAAVGVELHQRRGFQPNAGEPHWMVFNDQARVNAVWETLTRKDGVAGVTFVRMVTGKGSGVGFAKDTTLFVTADQIRTVSGPLAVPDGLDESSARTIARKMARYRAEGHAVSTSAKGPETVDLFEILGIEDPADIDLDWAWAATRSGPPWEENPWGKDWLRVPIGVDEHGGPVALDFKETHQGGMGHHMVLVGTTGSGKSEFLTTFCLSAASTHSPDDLNIAFFDFKGSTTAHKIAGLPHVVAAMNNLRNDSLWIDRMGDVIYGELERRKRMLDRARVSDAAEYEYLRIHAGERLEPLPALFVIIDEFTQLFIQHPPAKAVVDEIGRQGRALHVKMILGSQRLGHEMQTGVMTNIPIRVALRTLDDVDSRAVLGSDEAKWLPMKPAGAGLLKVEGRPRLTRFQTAFVSKNYMPPRRAAAEAVRSQVGYVPPRVFTVVGMEQLAAPAVTPEVVDAATPTTVLGPDGRPLRQVQAAADSLRRDLSRMRPVHRMWLPPLQPLPADDLVRRLRGRAWFEDYGKNKGLRFPVGVEDRPFQHAQRVYAVDMSGANCAVIGQGQSGKTTAVATMITGAALMYTPKRLQFYVVALSGPEVNATASLPHVGSLARATDPERVGRTVAEMVTLIEEREKAFRDLEITIDDFRRRKFGGEPGPVPEDQFGDVVMVIDGYAQFKASFEALEADVVAIMDRGPAHGVHVIVSAGGWVAGKLPSGMHPLLTANVELKLAQNDDMNRNKLAVAKAVPFGDREVLDEDDDTDEEAMRGDDRDTKIVKVRGRGTSMAGYHFQAGLPQLTVAGRLMGVGEAAATVSRVAGTSGAAEVRMLPERVSLDEVEAQWRRRGGGRPGQVPFGISEVGLLPAVADFGAAPHLLLAGNPECGLSSALRTLATSVMRAYTPEQARIYVVDPHTSLLQVVEGPHLGRYTYREQQVRDLAKEVAAVLETRLPPEDATQAELAAGGRWSGPHVFVFVDNEEAVQSWDSGNIFAEDGGYPLKPLMPYVDRGKEIGFHIVVARQIGSWGRAMGSPLAGRLLQLRVPGVVMDGDRSEGPIIGNVRAAEQPPGRGIYVTDKLAAPVQFAEAVQG